MPRISAWIYKATNELNLDVFVKDKGFAFVRMDGYTYLHAQVRGTHTAINGQRIKLVSAILFHGLEYRLGLKTRGLERGAGDMPTFCMLCNADFKIRDIIQLSTLLKQKQR